MDHLPIEIAAHILSFLPGEQVFRFKQLNSTLCKVISTYRDVLKYPEVTLSLSDDFQDRRVIHLNFQHGNRRWEIDYVYPRFVAFESCQPPIYFEFFDSFFAKRKRLEERSFRIFLDYIFARVDVAELHFDRFTQTDCMSILTESIEANRPRILSVTTDPVNFESGKFCDLLKSIADNRKCPRMVVDEVYTSIMGEFRLAPNFGEIKEITRLFREASLVTSVGGTTSFIQEFAEAWREDPTDIFFFDIYVQLIRGVREPYIVPRLEGQFNITTVLPDYFEDHHPDGLVSTISFEDRRTGSVLRFDKTNITPPQVYEDYQEGGLVRIQISAVLK